MAVNIFGFDCCSLRPAPQIKFGKNPDKILIFFILFSVVNHLKSWLMRNGQGEY